MDNSGKQNEKNTSETIAVQVSSEPYVYPIFIRTEFQIIKMQQTMYFI